MDSKNSDEFEKKTVFIKSADDQIDTKIINSTIKKEASCDDKPTIKNEQISSENCFEQEEQNLSSDPQIDRVEFIRFLLSLTQQLDKQKLELVSMTLCYELIKPNGICNLINASIDLDESSQQLTTLNQRFIKLSLIIAGLPKLCCSLELFYETVCDQLIKILLFNTTNATDQRRNKESNQLTKLINNLIVTICSALYKRSPRLFYRKFLYVIFNCFFDNNQIDDKKSNNKIVNLTSSNTTAEDKTTPKREEQKEFISDELERAFVAQKRKNEQQKMSNEQSINEKRVKFEFIKEEEEFEDGEQSDNNNTVSNSNQTVTNEARKLETTTETAASQTSSSSEHQPQQKKSNNSRIIRLKIDESIRIILILLANHFDRKEIVKYFKQYLFIKCVLYETECSLNQDLNNLLNELLMNIKNSEYLLDKTLFERNALDEFDKYKVHLDIERGLRTIVLKSSIEPEITLSNCSDSDNNGIELKKIDQITQCTVKLICSKSDIYKIDTFLLFLQRYSQKRTTDNQSSLLLGALIDTLMKSIITPNGVIILINHPEKAIDFVNLTLERLTLSYDTDIYELSTNQTTTTTTQLTSDEELKNSIKEDSLNMCLQIIEFVLQKQLFQSLFENLKQTLDRFVTVCSKSNLKEEIKRKAIELQNVLKSKSFISINKYEEDLIFKQAIKDLNSNLMPDRAHALITLKKLIHSKNSNINSNKSQLITVLKECLQDNESYIYLSAINTLAELALNYTDEVLPILIESFNDKNRNQMDRLKVGQVIVYLSKQLNEMAHCYAKPIMNMLLRASKDECDLIRVSTLSNLAEFCSVLKFKLNIYITEIMICIEYTLKSDPSIEVKRACIMFFHLLLNNLDQNSLYAIESELRNIYSLLKTVYSNTLDDLIQLHAQLALEQLNRIATEILQSINQVPNEIRFQLK